MQIKTKLIIYQNIINESNTSKFM